MKNANIAQSLARRAKVESNLMMLTMMLTMMMMVMPMVTMVNVYQVAVLGKILLVECEVFALGLLLAFAKRKLIMMMIQDGHCHYHRLCLIAHN